MYSLDVKQEIWNDKTRECISVGPDMDGLDLVEILKKDSEGKSDSQMLFTLEEAELLAIAVEATVQHLKEKQKSRHINT